MGQAVKDRFGGILAKVRAQVCASRILLRGLKE
jgi:hypothetical protein